MMLDVTHQKSNEANEKTPQGVSHVLRWMAGRVARPNPAKDYVWNASDPTDDLSPLLDMEDILGDDEDMTDRECAHFISTFFQNLSSPSLSLCVRVHVTVTRSDSLEKCLEEASKETFDVALLDGQLMRLALEETEGAAEKKKDDNEDLNNNNNNNNNNKEENADASNKSQPSDDSGGGSTTNIEKKTDIKTTLRKLCAKVPVVLMQRDEDEDKAENEAKTLAAKEEGNTVERLDAIHLRSLAAPVKNTVAAAAAKEDADNSNNNDNADMNDAATTANDENENSSNNNNNNNSEEEDAATKQHQHEEDEEDVVVRAIREGVCDVIRIPLARQNSANLWQHCVRNMLRDSGNVKMSEVLRRSGIMPCKKRILGPRTMRVEQSRNNGSDDSDEDTMMHLKASGSEEANKTDGTGNTAINEFNGAVVKVPSKTKGKRSQRKFGNRSWSAAASNAQLSSSFDQLHRLNQLVPLHPQQRPMQQQYQQQSQQQQQQQQQQQHHVQYQQLQPQYHHQHQSQQSQQHHSQQPQQVQYQQPQQQPQPQQPHNPMARMPSLQQHVGVLPKGQSAKLAKSKAQQRRLAIKPAHILPAPGPGGHHQQQQYYYQQQSQHGSYIDQTGRVVYYQHPLQQQQQQYHHVPPNMQQYQQYPQHPQHPQQQGHLHRVESMPQFPTTTGLNGSPVHRSHPYHPQHQQQHHNSHLHYQNPNAIGRSAALYQQGGQQNFAAGGGPAPKLPLGLKLTKSNSLKDLLRAHEIGKINKAIAADSANANGASSNGSPTTVANEHPLFNANAFGDDDEEILSLNNLPDNVDLNDLSVELDDSYLVF